MNENEDFEKYSDPGSVSDGDSEHKKDSLENALEDRSFQQIREARPEILSASTAEAGILLSKAQFGMHDTLVQPKQNENMNAVTIHSRFKTQIKELKLDINKRRLEMATHLELNRKLIQRAKELHKEFSDILAITVGAEATLKQSRNSSQLQVVVKDIGNMKKEIAIFRYQVQRESQKAARNCLDFESSIEKGVLKLQLDLQTLEENRTELVKRVDHTEKTLEALRKQLQSNVQIQLQEEIIRAEITLAKKEKKMNCEKLTLEKNRNLLESANQLKKLYDDLINDHYLEED